MKHLRAIIILSACLAGLAFADQHPEASTGEKWIAIRDATIWTVTKGRIEGGTILLKDGKIAGVGKRLEIPRSAVVIDALGGHVIPGLIDISSDLYLQSGDLRESRRFAAELDITDALDLYTPEAQAVLEEGVTSVYVGPGNRSLIGGLGAVVHVGTGPDLEAAVLEGKAALKMNLGVALDGRTSAEWRLGHYHEIREALRSAQRYKESWEKYDKDLAEYKKKKEEHAKKKAEYDKKKAGGKKKDSKEKPPEKPKEPKEPRKPRKDPGRKILVQAMAGEIPVRLETERTDSIRNALRLAKEFGLRLTLEGGAEAGPLASKLSKAGVHVILGPIVTSPLQGVDAALSRSETAGILSKAGVEVAIGTGGGGGLSSRYVRYQACLAVGHGMEAEAALRAITIVPAEILGVADRLGSIEEGKLADLVILDGEPLKSLSRVTHVIRGEEVIRVGASAPPRRDF